MGACIGDNFISYFSPLLGKLAIFQVLENVKNKVQDTKDFIEANM